MVNWPFSLEENVIKNVFMGLQRKMNDSLVILAKLHK
jgi:hypothetical protein